MTQHTAVAVGSRTNAVQYSDAAFPQTANQARSPLANRARQACRDAQSTPICRVASTLALPRHHSAASAIEPQAAAAMMANKAAPASCFEVRNVDWIGSCCREILLVSTRWAVALVWLPQDWIGSSCRKILLVSTRWAVALVWLPQMAAAHAWARLGVYEQPAKCRKLGETPVSAHSAGGSGPSSRCSQPTSWTRPGACCKRWYISGPWSCVAANGCALAGSFFWL